MKTTLTIEQSSELIKRGVSANKAHEIKVYDDPVSEWTHKGCPLFTLADLLSLVPKEIRKDTTPYIYDLHISWSNEQNKWAAMYIVYYDAMRCSVLYKTSREDLCDTLYELVIKLLDNYVKLD